MVRFKVVRASRLLLIAAVIALIVVVGLVGYQMLKSSPKASIQPTASFVEAQEAETETVFASSLTGLSLDPDGIEIEVIPQAAEEKPIPRVLIYHTHTHEAYEQDSDDPYEALEAWRTNDADHSVVRVGEALTQLLKSYGFEVTHDTTDHEGDALSTAYERSLKTLEGYKSAFDLYIDLHRDAYVDGDVPHVTLRSGEVSAQLMMLIGNGNGFEIKPWYAENLTFAEALEKRINAVEPGLCKPTLVKDGRYNQHIGIFTILVEVGHNRNTLQEALNAVPALAEGLYSLMIEDPDAHLTAFHHRFRENNA